MKVNSLNLAPIYTKAWCKIIYIQLSSRLVHSPALTLSYTPTETSTHRRSQQSSEMERQRWDAVVVQLNTHSAKPRHIPKEEHNGFNEVMIDRKKLTIALLHNQLLLFNTHKHCSELLLLLPLQQCFVGFQIIWHYSQEDVLLESPQHGWTYLRHLDRPCS